MNLRTACLAIAAAALIPAACAQTPAAAPAAPAAPPTLQRSAPILFFDIAGPDIAKQMAFYENVFGWRPTGDPYEDRGPKQNIMVTTAAPSTLKAALRTSAPEKVIYIGVPDITATLDKVVENGGRVEAARYEIKGVIVMGMFFDPAGNRMGLVEVDDRYAQKIP
jgi:predicted enzyme related to lactoylglutathione lyase